MTVAVIHHPFDESFSRDSIAALKAAGWTDAIRYVQGAGKGISKAEWDAFHAAGFSVTLVQEGGVQPAMRGYAGGVADATSANAAATAVGMPLGAAGAIYYVGDDPAPIAPSSYPTVANYFTGVAFVHGSTGRRIGVYGSAGQINYSRLHVAQITLEWPVRTWGLSAHPNLIQEPNPTMDTLGHTIDQNTAVTADWGQSPPPSAASNATSGCGEETGMILTAPGRVDEFVVGVDQRIYQATGHDYPSLMAATYAAVGPDTVKGKAVAAAWTPDYTTLYLWIHGLDDVPYLAAWTAAGWGGVAARKGALWPGLRGAPGLAGHDGLPGPQGIPGPTYDDRWLIQAGGKLGQAAMAFSKTAAT